MCVRLSTFLLGVFLFDVLAKASEIEELTF